MTLFARLDVDGVVEIAVELEVETVETDEKVVVSAVAVEVVEVVVVEVDSVDIETVVEVVTI